MCAFLVALELLLQVLAARSEEHGEFPSDGSVVEPIADAYRVIAVGDSWVYGAESLPSGLLAEQDLGQPERVAAAYGEFCRGVIDVVAPLVPAVKPQAAFFEQWGPAGCAALARVIRHARRAGLVVICDAKRGDIGSTARAYAEAYLAGEDPAAAAWAWRRVSMFSPTFSPPFPSSPITTGNRGSPQASRTSWTR